MLSPGDTPVGAEEIERFVRIVAEVSPGTYFVRDLDANRTIACEGLILGRGRIGIGPRGTEVYDDGQVWEFPTYRTALRAWATYRPDQTEPDGWDRHPDTGRYRLGGDDRCEFWKDADHQLHAVGPDVEIVNCEPRRRGDIPPHDPLDGG